MCRSNTKKFFRKIVLVNIFIFMSISLSFAQKNVGNIKDTIISLEKDTLTMDPLEVTGTRSKNGIGNLSETVGTVIY